MYNSKWDLKFIKTLTNHSNVDLKNIYIKNVNFAIMLDEDKIQKKLAQLQKSKKIYAIPVNLVARSLR